MPRCVEHLKGGTAACLPANSSVRAANPRIGGARRDADRVTELREGALEVAQLLGRECGVVAGPGVVGPESEGLVELLERPGGIAPLLRDARADQLAVGRHGEVFRDLQGANESTGQHQGIRVFEQELRAR